jgi:hypothetical protein
MHTLFATVPPDVCGFGQEPSFHPKQASEFFKFQKSSASRAAEAP